MISDIWDPNTRGKALGIFTLGPFAGPALAPLVSGFMATSGVSWRWTFWVLTLFASACFFLIFFTLPETYVYVLSFFFYLAKVRWLTLFLNSPILLVKKAAKLRKETGDSRYWAPLDKQHMGFVKRAQHVVGRPFKILALEPMLLAITLYMSVSLFRHFFFTKPLLIYVSYSLYTGVSTSSSKPTPSSSQEATTSTLESPASCSSPSSSELVSA